MWNAKILVSLLVLCVLYTQAQPSKLVDEQKKELLDANPLTGHLETSTVDEKKLLEALKVLNKLGGSAKDGKPKRGLTDKMKAAAKKFNALITQMKTTLKEMYGKTAPSIFNKLNPKQTADVSKIAGDSKQSKGAYRRKLSAYFNKAKSPGVRQYFETVQRHYKLVMKKAKQSGKKLKGEALKLYKQLMSIASNEKISLKSEKERFKQLLKGAKPATVNELKKEGLQIPGLNLQVPHLAEGLGP